MRKLPPAKRAKIAALHDAAEVVLLDYAEHLAVGGTVDPNLQELACCYEQMTGVKVDGLEYPA